jgi:hypothetical protein
LVALDKLFYAAFNYLFGNHAGRRGGALGAAKPRLSRNPAIPAVASRHPLVKL